MSSHFPEWSEAAKAKVRARIDAKMAELETRINARKVVSALARLSEAQRKVDGFAATAPDLQIV